MVLNRCLLLMSMIRWLITHNLLTVRFLTFRNCVRVIVLIQLIESTSPISDLTYLLPTTLVVQVKQFVTCRVCMCRPTRERNDLWPRHLAGWYTDSSHVVQCRLCHTHKSASSQSPWLMVKMQLVRVNLRNQLKSKPEMEAVGLNRLN